MYTALPFKHDSQKQLDISYRGWDVSSSKSRFHISLFSCWAQLSLVLELFPTPLLCLGQGEVLCHAQAPLTPAPFSKVCLHPLEDNTALDSAWK